MKDTYEEKRDLAYVANLMCKLGFDGTWQDHYDWLQDLSVSTLTEFKVCLERAIASDREPATLPDYRE